MYDDIFLTAGEYASILVPSIFSLTVIFLADEIVVLLKRSVMASNKKRRKRYD